MHEAYFIKEGQNFLGKQRNVFTLSKLFLYFDKTHDFVFSNKRKIWLVQKEFLKVSCFGNFNIKTHLPSIAVRKVCMLVRKYCLNLLLMNFVFFPLQEKNISILFILFVLFIAANKRGARFYFIVAEEHSNKTNLCRVAHFVRISVVQIKKIIIILDVF